MHERWFDQRQLKCFYWDGKTDYKVVKETDEALETRINQFGDWLEGQELPEELQVRTAEDVDGGKIKEKREEKQAEKAQA